MKAAVFITSLFRIPSLLIVLVEICSIAHILSFSASHTLAQSRPAFLSNNVSYAWPTNASRYMSSSFGETRSAHFHAAMDIGTWGQEGYAVFAARDGIVHRVAVGPAGYGNVIYLKHDDGSISLYAHLRDFHPDIRSIVDSLRMQNYMFEYDELFEDYNHYFRRGEQIGWTGSTGVGPPHLHFELRTPEGHPFNPMLAGYRIEDTISPQFSGLVIEPLSPISTINGRKEIYRIPTPGRGDPYHFGTVEISGEIGLAVDVFDRANSSNNVHAVYDLKMYVDDKLYFHSQADSFSYDQSRQIFLDRVYSILTEERKGYQRLYLRNGNTLPFYHDTGHTGRLNLSPGTRHIRIEASDFFGNQSLATLQLNVTEPDSRPLIEMPIVAGKSRPGRASPSGLYWYNNWVHPITTSFENDAENIKRNRNSEILLIRPVGSYGEEARPYVFSHRGLPLDIAPRMELQKSDSTWALNRIDPAHHTSVYHENMRISVHFPPESFFEPVTQGISGVYPDLYLFPNNEPFRRPAVIRILLDEKLAKTKGVGLYQTDPVTGKLSHISSYVDQRNKALVGSVRNGGHFTVRTDSAGPVITSPQLEHRAYNNRYYASVFVEDDLSGIDYPSAEFYVNKTRGIAEFDPEKNLLIYHHPNFSPQSTNEITVRVPDLAGNWSEMTFTDVPYN